MKKSPRPPCFESDEQWEEWRRAARLTAGSVVRFCSDCLPSYRDAMISQGRCSHPGTVFVIEQGGAIVGIRPVDPTWRSAVTGHCEYSTSEPRREVISLPSHDVIQELLRRMG